jgi:HK97 family phage major capsid protein
MKIHTAAELREAKQKRKELTDKLRDTNKPEMSADETRAWNELKSTWDALDANITEFEAEQERQTVLDDIEAREQRGAGGQPAAKTPGKIPAQVRSKERLHVFSNLGEQLVAVRNQALTGGVDERLSQVNAEARALGNNESVGAEFGFTVQNDFTVGMFESAAEEGDLLSLVDTYEVGANSDSARWIDIDESDISTTVFGGVQMYWAAESKTVEKSKPETRETKIDLQKLMGFAYATEETLQDSNFASQLYNRAFGLAINRQLSGDIVAANGVGKPLGILKSPALLEVAKETAGGAQAADTVVYQNFVHMWGRLLPRLRRNAIWLMHPDVEEILPLMNFPIGQNGVPVFLPAGGISGSPFSTLYGRPIMPTDHCSALGDKGDVILTDPKEYVLITKGGVQAASSIHVAFLTAENCFRFIMRANGAPKRRSQITIKNSANKRSAYVTLAARA